MLELLERGSRLNRPDRSICVVGLSAEKSDSMMFGVTDVDQLGVQLSATGAESNGLGLEKLMFVYGTGGKSPGGVGTVTPSIMGMPTGTESPGHGGGLNAGAAQVRFSGSIGGT